jgi:hypothetical protein
MEQRFYRLSEIAKMYKISPRTLKSRLEAIHEQLYTVGYDEDGEPNVWDQRVVLFSPNQIKIIFNFLGEPTMEV